MTIIDWAIVGLTALSAVWGFSRGLTVGTVALAGFGAGAVLGASVAPLVLDGGGQSVHAPLIAFPAALLLGGLVAAVVERIGLRQGRLLDRLGAVGAFGGALLAGFLALAAAWILGAALAQLDPLKDPVKSSAILKRLNAVLRPPGPAFASEASFSDRFPTIEGPAPDVLPGDPLVSRDPEVRTASRSVVRIAVTSCEGSGAGSGWIAANGIVATNAHVVFGEETTTVQIQGRGPDYDATPVWFDSVNDIALLRVSGLKGVAALSIAHQPKAGTSAAILGFPGGVRQKTVIRPARLGGTSDRRPGRIGASDPPLPGFPSRLYGRSITAFSGRAQPGNSGGPVVDTRGRVLTTVFGGFQRRFFGLGVPNAIVRSALRRAGPPVGTGSCRESG